MSRLNATRERLKDATSAIHSLLHHAVPFAQIAGQTMSRVEYVRLLEVLCRFHATVAPICRVGAHAIGMPILTERGEIRLERLRRDLGSLGESTIFPAPSAADVSDPAAVGYLYTVQGSSLGGHLIYRQLDYLLPTPEGRRFFQGSPDDGAVWREFCAKLDRYGADCTALPDMLDGAQAGFEVFRSCLETY